MRFKTLGEEKNDGMDNGVGWRLYCDEREGSAKCWDSWGEVFFIHSLFLHRLADAVLASLISVDDFCSIQVKLRSETTRIFFSNRENGRGPNFRAISPHISVLTLGFFPPDRPQGKVNLHRPRSGDIPQTRGWREICECVSCKRRAGSS